jgi:hypothetical protein
VPEGQNLDATRFCVDLVVEVVASPTQKEAPNALLLGVTSSRSDPRLGRDEFERSLKVVREGKWRCGAIGSRPRRGPPDVCRGAEGRLDRKACDQGLLAKFPEESLRIDELPPCRLLEGLFQGDLLVGC